MIGNKIDCDPSEREVERDLADSFMKNHGIEHYFEISCKTGETIEIKTNNSKTFDDIFVKVIELCCKDDPSPEPSVEPRPISPSWIREQNM